MESSRLDSARQRLRAAKIAIGTAAVLGFVGAAVAARAAHPGTHSSGTSVTRSSATQPGDDAESQDDNSFGFGSSSVSPDTGSFAPSVQSSGS